MQVNRTKLAPILAGCFVAAGAFVRVLWALEFDTTASHDMKAYLEFAQGIADGQGYIALGEPTAYWPVGYPAALAMLLKVGGGDLLVARLAQVVFGVIGLGCVYYIARTLFASRVAGVVAVALGAFDITQIAYTSVLVSEPLFNCLMLVGTAVAVRGGASRTRLLVGGAVLGLAAYTRPHGLLLPLLVGLLPAIPPPRTWRLAVVRVAWLYLGLAAVMAPWWVRNALVFDAFVPVSNNGGINLFIGNNPMATGGYKWGKKVKAPLEAVHKGRWRGGRGEYERGQKAAKLARDHAFQHPARTLKLAQVKIETLYKPDLIALRWNKHQATEERRKRRELKQVWQPRLRWFHALLCGIAALGALVSLGNRARALVAIHLAAAALAWHYDAAMVAVAAVLTMLVQLTRRSRFGTSSQLPLAIVVTFTLVHVAYFANGRFLYPMRPWMTVLAGVFVAWLVGHLPGRIWGTADGPGESPTTSAEASGQRGDATAPVREVGSAS